MTAVLLVGMDEPDQRRLLSLLKSAGHATLKASTRQFLERVDEEAVNVVVIDISPLRHGAHLVGIAELRQRHPGLPILAICGGRDAGMLLDIAVQAGADATLRKPFTRDQFFDALRRCLTAQEKS